MYRNIPNNHPSTKRFCHGLRKPLLVCIICSLAGAASFSLAANYSATVTGNADTMADVLVTLQNRTTLITVRPDETGVFEFTNIEPGEYVIKVKAPGYKTTAARPVTIPLVEPAEPFKLERITDENFVFHWEEDQSTAGFEYASAINNPVQVQFLGNAEELADTPQTGQLLSEFNVVLDEGDLPWSAEHSFRLYQMLSATGGKSSYYLKDSDEFSRWRLTSEEIPNDIEITKHDDGMQDVRIASSAFVNASPKIVEIDGRRGIWYSQRLHHAVVRFVTDNGKNKHQVARILSDRFGVSLNPDYQALTQYTTGESASSFQAFQSEELISLINLMEEMPHGFHKIPQLSHIVRRVNGMPHPRHPTAPAVAWPTAGYIEFMESAFTQTSVHDIHRLILHEKAHFIWEHVLDEATRDDWIELGQWYEDPEATSGWSTHQTTQFVSAYAHLKNPNEDMTESIADFVVNPEVLKTRAPEKYEFIRDRIMLGNVYVSQIREDLTFEVFNLYPDYVYPGKIRRVDISVEGGPKEDKILKVEIELHAQDNDPVGASHAYFRVASDVKTFFDMYLYAVDEHGTRVNDSLVLRGSAKLSKHTKAGYWYPVQVKIYDRVGNARYQRTNTFDMKIHLNNELEDYTPPEYVSNSLNFESRAETRNINGVDRVIQVLSVSWDVDEETQMRDNWPCYTRLVVNREGTGSFDEFGHLISGRCLVEFNMPQYMPSGTYSVRFISMTDQATNTGKHVFLHNGTEAVPQIELSTNNQDLEPPEIDVNRIYVEAEPTNPEKPNGETRLEITYHIRDDNSGLEDTAIRLRDPQGGQHFKWHVVPDRGRLFSQALPNEWQKLTLIWTLPPGSPPGTWGIASMMSQDKARNQKRYSFTEVIHVDVQNTSNIMMIR